MDEFSSSVVEAAQGAQFVCAMVQRPGENFSNKDSVRSTIKTDHEIANVLFQGEHGILRLISSRPLA